MRSHRSSLARLCVDETIKEWIWLPPSVNCISLGLHERVSSWVSVGGTEDVSLIIDFLAAYLFPSGERKIEEFMVTGMSLGGSSSIEKHPDPEKADSLTNKVMSLGDRC